MRDKITAHDIANNIRMLRTQHSGSFLILEGIIDSRFYKRFIDEEKCKIIPAYNKENVLNTLFLLEEDKFAGILAIIDADFSNLEGRKEDSKNLFYTDYHDLEIFLLASPALEKLLIEFGSENKIKKLGKDIRFILCNSGLYIGYLRWVSLRESLFLKFEDMPFNKFVNINTLNIEPKKLIEVVINHSQRYDLMVEDIEIMINTLWNDKYNSLDVCCGHDLIHILSIGLRKLIGSNNANEVKPDVIERSIRLAYEKSYFYDTDLYKSIRDWCTANTPFLVF